MQSSEFRRQYAKLTEVTQVEANGHVIGTWTPVAAMTLVPDPVVPTVTVAGPASWNPPPLPDYSARPVVAVPKAQPKKAAGKKA